MLHIEGQCLGIAALSDQVSGIQSHVLVQNLVVLWGGEQKHGPGGDLDEQPTGGGCCFEAMDLFRRQWA